MFKTWSITEKTSFLVPLGNPGAAVRGRVPRPGHGPRAAAPSGGGGGLVRFLLFLRAPRDPGLPFPSPPRPPGPPGRVPGLSRLSCSWCPSCCFCWDSPKMTSCRKATGCHLLLQMTLERRFELPGSVCTEIKKQTNKQTCRRPSASPGFTSTDSANCRSSAVF